MPTPNLFDETFEGSGYAVMTGATLIGANSSLDPDYATSNVGSPGGWSSQCLQAVSGTPETQTRKLHQLGSLATGNLYFRDEIVITGSPPSGATNIVFSVWNSGFVNNLFHVEVLNVAGVLWLRLDYNTNSTRGTSDFVGASVDTRYTVEVNYDMSAGSAWGFRVNGSTVGSGALTGVFPSDLSFIVVGSNVFDNAASAATIVHDNLGVGDVTWLGSSAGVTLSGTATAGITEDDIVAGGKVLDFTVSGDTWIT